jgi:hypothetical protein
LYTAEDSKALTCENFIHPVAKNSMDDNLLKAHASEVAGPKTPAAPPNCCGVGGGGFCSLDQLGKSMRLGKPAWLSSFVEQFGKAW